LTGFASPTGIRWHKTESFGGDAAISRPATTSTLHSELDRAPRTAKPAMLTTTSALATTSTSFPTAMSSPPTGTSVSPTVTSTKNRHPHTTRHSTNSNPPHPPPPDTHSCLTENPPTCTREAHFHPPPMHGSTLHVVCYTPALRSAACAALRSHQRSSAFDRRFRTDFGRRLQHPCHYFFPSRLRFRTSFACAIDSTHFHPVCPVGQDSLPGF
jgi:hypothetical protein